MKEKDLMVILKLGTRHTRILVARRSPEWRVDWNETLPSSGVSRGAVINGRKAAETIRTAMEAVAAQYGCRVEHARLAVQGVNMLSGNASCAVDIAGRVTDRDIRRAQESFLAMKPPNGQLLLHALPQEYQLGPVISRDEPCGRNGSPLSSNAHLVTLSRAALEDLLVCMRDARVTVDRMVLQSLAAGEALLNADEKDYGTLVIQMGAGVTEFFLHTGCGPSCSGSLLLGGGDLTHAVARQFLLDRDMAERLVLAHGCARHLEDSPQVRLRLAQLHRAEPLRIQRRELNTIVEAFAEAIFAAIRDRLGREDWLARIDAGIVLTGGLAALPGAADLAARVFGLPVRVGSAADPLDPSGLAAEPGFTALLGVLRISIADPQPVRPPDILRC